MNNATSFHWIDAVPQPIVVIRADERIAAANILAQPLVGRDSVGRHYITALRQPNLLDAIEAALADGGTRRTRFLGTRSGNDTTFDVTVAATEGPEGVAVIVTFIDVTAIEAAGQMRRDFVANVSHELRTPLTALLGFVETLRGAARDDAAARDRFLEIMEREAGRMSRLVQDLLTLSRVEDDERLRPMAPVDLAGLIRATKALLAPVARAAGVSIVTEIPEGAALVPGDAEQLRQVLGNLIENAIKYGGRGGAIVVRLSAPQSEPGLRAEGLRLSVTDQGEGIDSHHIPRLTERFYRVDSHRSREVGGTGLGLAIVKHIVNRHRGRLRIDSVVGEGTTVTVLLPLT